MIDIMSIESVQKSHRKAHEIMLRRYRNAGFSTDPKVFKQQINSKMIYYTNEEAKSLTIAKKGNSIHMINTLYEKPVISNRMSIHSTDWFRFYADRWKETDKNKLGFNVDLLDRVL